VGIADAALRLLGYKNPFEDFAIFYFIGMFFNLFAPSTVGGDVGRVYYLSSGGAGPERDGWVNRTGTALSSVVADRAIGVAVLVWIGALAVVIFPVYSLPSPIRYSTFALALGLLVGWILLPVIYRVIRLTVNPIGKSIAIAIETYGSAGKPIAMAIILSLIVHFIQAGCHVILGLSLDFQIPWSYSFILYPLVGIFMAIPVSFNGISLREGGVSLFASINRGWYGEGPGLRSPLVRHRCPGWHDRRGCLYLEKKPRGF